MALAIASSTLALMKASVEVNGVSVPLNKTVDALRRFCQPAMFHAESDTFDVGPSGSALFFQYRGQNFGLCTQHQFGSGSFTFPPQAFSLILEAPDGQKIGVPPNETISVSFDNKGHHSLSDFYLARFDQARDGRPLRAHFLELNFRETLSSVSPQQIQFIVAIGFPTEARDVCLTPADADIPTGADMTLRWIKLFLDVAQPSQIDTPNRRPLVIPSACGATLTDPDGLSGAPVFFVYLDPSSQAHFGFAGIITHSNGHRFMVYEADTIRLLLDECLASSSE